MVDQIVVRERLFDVVETEFVELLKNARVGKAVGAVGVYGQRHVGERVADGA